MNIRIERDMPDGFKILGQVNFDIIQKKDKSICVAIQSHGPNVEEKKELSECDIRKVLTIVEDIRDYGHLKYFSYDSEELSLIKEHYRKRSHVNKTFEELLKEI